MSSRLEQNYEMNTRTKRNLRALALFACAAPALPAQADLSVASIQFPDTWKAGRSETCSAVIANSGLTTTSATNVGIYRSTNSTISKSDTLLATLALPALPKQVVYPVSTKLTLPTATPTQNAWIGVYADNAGLVNEINESNNTKSKAVQLQAMPQLVITALSVPSLTAGEKFALEVSVKNTGAAASGEFSLGIAASDDKVLRAGSDDLIYAYQASSLAGGASRKHVFSGVTWPANIDGERFVGVIVDIGDQVDEAVEVSNSGFRRTIQPHSASGAYLNFASPRFAKRNGAASPTDALFRYSGTAQIDVRAPGLPFHAYALVWSQSGGQLTIDAMTDLGLQLLATPVLPGHIGHVDAFGNASASIHLPPGVFADVDFYTHSVWFTSGFGPFVGTGQNAIRTRVQNLVR